MADGTSGGYLNALFRGMGSTKGAETIKQSSCDTSNSRLSIFYTTADGFSTDNSWPTTSPDEFTFDLCTTQSKSNMAVASAAGRRGSLGNFLPKSFTDTLFSPTGTDAPTPTTYNVQTRRQSLQIDVASYVPENKLNQQSFKVDDNNNDTTTHNNYTTITHNNNATHNNNNATNNTWSMSLFRRNTMSNLCGIPENENQTESSPLPVVAKSQSAVQMSESDNSIDPRDRRNSAPAQDLSVAIRYFQAGLDASKDATKTIETPSQVSKQTKANFTGALSRRLLETREQKSRGKEMNMLAPSSW